MTTDSNQSDSLQYKRQKKNEWYFFFKKRKNQETCIDDCDCKQNGKIWKSNVHKAANEQIIKNKENK